MPRRSLFALAALAALSLTACTSSGNSAESQAPAARATQSAPQTPPSALLPPSAARSSGGSAAGPSAPAGPWTTQQAGEQLTRLLEAHQRLATSVPVGEGATFAQFHQALAVNAQACDELVAGLRQGHWPAAVGSQVRALISLQSQECATDEALAAAPNPQALQAVPRLPSDHAGKILDARVALETALGL